jgi:hypothetical protein
VKVFNNTRIIIYLKWIDIHRDKGKEIQVAVLSKMYACIRLIADITGSNPAEGMDVCLLLINL